MDYTTKEAHTNHPWQAPLDTLRAATAELDATLVHVEGEDLTTTIGVLRATNRALWRMIDQLEAGRVAYLYDMAGLLRQVYEENLDVTSNWLELADNGVLGINPKELLKFAEKRGIDVSGFLATPAELEASDDVGPTRSMHT